MYISVIIAIATVLMIPTVNVLATSNENGFTDDDFSASRSQRPPINPEFDPDYSCLFDVYQVQCIPGSQQECPRPQFGNNDDSTCFPMTLVNGEWEWECPDGYHTVNDDETGQCYPDEEGCQFDDYILVESLDRDGYVCAHLSDECGKDEHREEDYCVNYCIEYPERNACRPD